VIRSKLRSGPRASLPGNLKIHKNGIFYARLYVPKRLQRHIGYAEVVRSLHTANRREAEFLLALVKLNFQKIIQMSELYPSLSGAMFINVTRRYLERVQEAARRDFLKTAVPSPQIDGRPSTGDLMAEEADNFIQARLVDLENRHFGAVTDAVAEILTKEKIEVALPQDSRDALAYLTLRAQIEAAGLTADLYRGKQDPFQPREPIDAIFKAVPAQDPLPGDSANAMSFGELGERYLRTETAGLKARTRVKYKWQVEVATLFFGTATAANSIDRRKVRGYLDLLQKMPSNFAKRFKGKSLAEIAALPAEQRLPLLKPSAINPYMITLAQVFAYGDTLGEVPQNPATKMQLKDPVKAKDKRLPFSADQLRQLFNQPLFTGHDGCHWDEPGKTIKKDIRYWAPLIALFTGMRLGEICALTPDCIVTDDGVLAFDVRDAKTSSGIRKVPIPNQLLAIGILDFINRTKVGQTVCGDSSRDSVSKFFTRFLATTGIDTDRRCFHSFRHTFIDAARAGRVGIGYLKAIVGHAGGTTTDNYGSALPLSDLQSEMGKMTFWGLDVSHLIPPTGKLARRRAA